MLLYGRHDGGIIIYIQSSIQTQSAECGGGWCGIFAYKI